ncbi:MAG: hypothetical protein HUJ53_08455 [Holdemanella sp.]|nr:hypothetical protein [Holdemanella sp.]
MMLQVIHLEPEDFNTILFSKKLKINARVYVLECNVAGVVYMASDDDFLYYLDRFYPTKEKKCIIDNLNFYDLHKELYRIINLDQYTRDRNKSYYSL